MPSGLGDAWEGAKNIVEDVTTKAVEGTKRAVGIADALTFNLSTLIRKNHLKVMLRNMNKRTEQ